MGACSVVHCRSSSHSTTILSVVTWLLASHAFAASTDASSRVAPLAFIQCPPSGTLQSRGSNVHDLPSLPPAGCRAPVLPAWTSPGEHCENNVAGRWYGRRAGATVSMSVGQRLPKGLTLAPGLIIVEGKVVCGGDAPKRGEKLAEVDSSKVLLEPLWSDSGAEDGVALIDAQVRLAAQLVERSGQKDWEMRALLASGDEEPAPLHRWDDEELAELQWAGARAAADGERARIREALERFTGAFSPNTWGGIALALNVVRRSALRAGGNLVLSPLLTAPLFQSSAPRGSLLALGDGGKVVEVLSEGPRRGADERMAVAISRGWRSNEELLLEQGWADPALASDSMAVSLDALVAAADGVRARLGQPPPSQEALAFQREVVRGLESYRYVEFGTPEREGKGEVGEGGSPVAMFAGGFCSDGLGMVAQALSIADADRESRGLQGCVMSIGEAVPLSLEVETQAGRVLAEVAETLLQNFPTTLVEDEALLAQGALPREMAALMFRISRKRLLQECRDRCLAWVDRPTVTGGTLRFSFFFTQNLPLHPAAREASVAMSSKEDLASKAHSKRTRR